MGRHPNRPSGAGPGYETGYGKPPAKHRFPPGRSGNPRGRPRKAKPVAAEIDDLLRETITVMEGGRKKTMTRQTALLRTVYNTAMKGDVRATQLLLNLQEVHHHSSATSIDGDLLSSEDRALLHDFARRMEDDITMPDAASPGPDAA